jgi:hypothetical protein
MKREREEEKPRKGEVAGGRVWLRFSGVSNPKVLADFNKLK